MMTTSAKLIWQILGVLKDVLYCEVAHLEYSFGYATQPDLTGREVMVVAVKTEYISLSKTALAFQMRQRAQSKAIEL